MLHPFEKPPHAPQKRITCSNLTQKTEGVYPSQGACARRSVRVQNHLPCDKLRALRHKKTYQRHPVINKLVSQASQVEEKCFRSKRPNFAKQKRILPVSRASRCSLQSASGAGAGAGGGPTKKPRHLAWFPLAPPAGLEPATP